LLWRRVGEYHRGCLRSTLSTTRAFADRATDWTANGSALRATYNRAFRGAAHRPTDGTSYRAALESADWAAFHQLCFVLRRNLWFGLGR